MQNGGRIRPESIRLKDGYTPAASNVVPIRDSLHNVISGMGTTTDQRTYTHHYARHLSDHEIDQAYRGSAYMRKAIDKPATEMVREWRDWQADSADIEKLEAEEKRLDLRNKVRKAEILRGLGGGGMVLYVPDADQMQPLNPATIKTGDLKQIHVWHRSRFMLGEMVTDWGDPWFGHPSYYQVQLQGTVNSLPIRFHPSRVVAFKGEHVGDIIGADWASCFWGQSRVQTIMDAIKNVETAENGFATLITQARLRRIYIPELLDLVSTAEGQAQLAKRLQTFALGESTNAVSWLDGGDDEGKGAEKIEDHQVTWTGMDLIINSYRTAAAAAADMPVTVMWGTSPAGLNATGQSDLDLYDKMIRGKQDLDLRPCMTQIDAALVPSALGRVDDDIWYEWAPLSSQSEKDEATTFWNWAQGLQILVNTGLIPDEAMSRGVQNEIEERGWIAGIGDALALLPEDERFMTAPKPELDANGNPIDPNAITQPVTKGGDQQSAGGAGSPARRANDSGAIETVRSDSMNDAIKLFMDTHSLPESARSEIISLLVAEGEQRRPFDDGYNPGEPRNERGEWTSGGAMRILQHVTKVLSGKGNHPPLSLGKVSETNAALVKRHTGHDIAGHERVLEASDIRHAVSSHGNAAQEAARGQKAITKQDFTNIPHIVEHAHMVELKGEPKSSQLQRLVYHATIDDDHYEYVEAIRPNGKVVALKTMLKR